MKPLSPATISRLLTVCAATVRKSLQGLDYIAADGAKAFDDLSALAVKLKDKCVCDGEWFSYCQEALKAGKQFIKIEYKVCLVYEVPIFNNNCCIFSPSVRNYFSFLTGSYHTRIPRR